jgi:starvation-inducible DNA-binding protein
MEKATVNSLEKELQVHLADLFVLYMKVYKFHWNLKGETFLELHKYYNKIFDYIADVIDETAERMRALKMYAPCSCMEYCELSKIKEVSGYNLSLQESMGEVIQDLNTLNSNLDSLYKVLDDASVSLFTNHSLQFSKQIWFLESCAE